MEKIECWPNWFFSAIYTCVKNQLYDNLGNRFRLLFVEKTDENKKNALRSKDAQRLFCWGGVGLVLRKRRLTRF
jgi:hypothetical protein